LALFQYADSPEAALEILRGKLTEYYIEPELAVEAAREAPEIAKSRI
jgi:hypothetical protein